MAQTGKRNYELIVIYDPTIATDIDAAKADVESNLKKREIEVVQNDDWGNRRLFHPPRHTLNGHFQYFKFQAEPNKISQVNSDLKVSQNVMKSMVAVLN